jgi:glycolate oxidase iron-sulfur subunit
MHEYPLLFAGTEHEERATRFAEKVRDVSEFLVELGPRPAAGLDSPMKIAYHDACHLAHAQGIRSAPRALLAAIPGVTLVPLTESEICCGSAGTYNVEQPEIARALGHRKAEAVLATGADVVATGNIGCINQIATHLAALGANVPVMHTVEVLDLAYRGASAPDSAFAEAAEGAAAM